MTTTSSFRSTFSTSAPRAAALLAPRWCSWLPPQGSWCAELPGFTAPSRPGTPWSAAWSRAAGGRRASVVSRARTAAKCGWVRRIGGSKSDATVRFPGGRDAMIRRADSCRAADDRSAGALAAEVGAYLTDGVFLYRVDDLVATRAGAMADLEDCYRLDVVRVPMAELQARRLRTVTPARGPVSAGVTRPG